jgi:hypothetical protein
METFLTYCNTRQFLTNRRKDKIFSNSFYLSDAELKRWHVSRVQLEEMPQIKTVGVNKYNVVGVSEIDFSLVKPHGQPLTDLHEWMLERVCETEMPKGVEVSAYWNSFLKHRSQFPTLFFTVDEFAGRVHTPISGMSKEFRPMILLRNEKTVSLDASQMQPTLLGEILRQAVGENSFSATIDEGTDVYLMLQSTAKLASRDEAKKRFFQILFGKPNEEMAKLFEGASWIEWINKYKSTIEPRNPHGKEKTYSNLAWILQTLEVRVMSEIWRTLAESGIPFLTVHDEIICIQSDAQKVETIFHNELSKHFKTFKISTK